MFNNLFNLFNFIFKYAFFLVNYINKYSNFQMNILVLSTWFYPFILFIKYNSFFYKTMLLDMNTFDYNKVILLSNNKKVVINCLTYYFFSIIYNVKINLFTFISDADKINSISFLFNNALWIERELSEMFNIYFLNKLDNRNLLLDYSYIGNPLLKSFPVIGNVELFYNYLNNWMFYAPIILKESSKIEFYYY